MGKMTIRRKDFKNAHKERVINGPQSSSLWGRRRWAAELKHSNRGSFLTWEKISLPLKLEGRRVSEKVHKIDNCTRIWGIHACNFFILCPLMVLGRLIWQWLWTRRNANVAAVRHNVVKICIRLTAAKMGKRSQLQKILRKTLAFFFSNPIFSILVCQQHCGLKFPRNRRGSHLVGQLK